MLYSYSMKIYRANINGVEATAIISYHGSDVGKLVPTVIFSNGNSSFMTALELHGSDDPEEVNRHGERFLESIGFRVQ